MKSILQMTLVMTILMLVSACGENSDAPAAAAPTQETNKTDTGCPTGTWFNSNGYNDFISVSVSGMITIKDRTGGSATGSVTCNKEAVHLVINSGGQSYTLSSQPGRVFWYAQKAGTYECQYSVSGNVFQFYCPDVAADDGNKFNPAQTYYVQQ